MNLLVSLIITTVAITAMIVIRMIAAESVFKERLKSSRSDSDCDPASCFSGCGSGRSDSAAGPARDSKRRSAPNAS